MYPQQLGAQQPPGPDLKPYLRYTALFPFLPWGEPRPAPHHFVNIYRRWKMAGALGTALYHPGMHTGVHVPHMQQIMSKGPRKLLP